MTSHIISNRLGYNDNFSNTISWIRFPLAILVVFLHSRAEVRGAGANLADMPLLSFWTNLLSANITRIAVPSFFWISGYLFFNKLSQWDWTVYIGKIKRRIGTLIVPFLFWNAFVLAIYYLIQTLMPSLINNEHTMIHEYDLWDFLKAFGFDIMDYPICYQLWFVRDLIVLIVLAPIIHFIVSRFRKYSYIITFAIVVLILAGGGRKFNDDLFFVFGACFSIYNFDVVPLIKRCGIYATLVFGVLLLINMSTVFCLSAREAMIFCGVLSVFWLASLNVIQRISISETMKRSAFFIYAYHGLALMAITRFLVKALNVNTDLGYCMVYLISPIITIAMGVGICKIVNRFKYGYILTGNKANNKKDSCS